MATVVLAGTLDTKGRELDYLRGRLREQDVDVILVDAGTYEPQAQSGAEKALSGLPDFQEVSAGSLPDWSRGAAHC